MLGGKCKNRHHLHSEPSEESCRANKEHSLVCVLCKGSYHKGTDQCCYVRQGSAEATTAWACEARDRAEKPCLLTCLKLWLCNDGEEERSSDTKGLCFCEHTQIASISFLFRFGMILAGFVTVGLMLYRWKSRSQSWENREILLNPGLKISWEWLNTMWRRRYCWFFPQSHFMQHIIQLFITFAQLSRFCLRFLWQFY